MYRLVVTEKHSVAQSIAAVLGADKRENGYISGNGWLVSWCIGHLAELAEPAVYDSLGGSGYQWTIDDCFFLFYIPRDTNEAESIEVSKVNTDTSNNDDYWGDEDSYDYNVSLDSNLYGRWRELTGSAWINLDEYGNASTNMHINSLVTIGNPEYAVWEAENGRLKVTGTYRFDIEYRLDRESIRDFDAEKEANDGTAKWKAGRETIWMYDAEYVRHKGSPEGTGIVGEWCVKRRGDNSTPLYIFNADGTGFIHSSDPMTWTFDDEMIYTRYQL